MLIIASVATRAAFAIQDEIVVQDTLGIPRSTSLVEGLGRVDCSVVDGSGSAMEGAIVNLSNTTTAETLAGSTVLGLASFENIAPGIWTVSSPTAGATISEVTVLAVSAGAAGTSVAPSVLMGAASTGGTAAAVALGVAATGGGSGSSPELSPSS